MALQFHKMRARLASNKWLLLAVIIIYSISSFQWIFTKRAIDTAVVKRKEAIQGKLPINSLESSDGVRSSLLLNEEDGGSPSTISTEEQLARGEEEKQQTNKINKSKSSNSIAKPISLHDSRKNHSYETGIAQEKELINPKSTSKLFHFGIVGCDDYWKKTLYSILFTSRKIVSFSSKFQFLADPGKEKMQNIIEEAKEFKKVLDRRTIRGFVWYHEPLTTSTSLARMETFFPSTKLIYMVKHPVDWMADYMTQLQLQHKAIMPDITEILMMKCGVGYDRGMNDTYKPFRHACADQAMFHVHLSRLGYTPLNSDEELSLLGDLDDEYSVHDFSKSKLFLLDYTQLEDGNDDRNNQFIHDLRNFLEIDSSSVSLHTDSVFEKKKYRTTYRTQYRPSREHLRFDICSPTYKELRDKLTKIGADSSKWIEDYFLKSPNVVVANKNRFLESIRKWKTDPCELPEEEVFDPEYTSSLYQWGVVGTQKCGTTFIYESFLKHDQIPTLTKEDHHLHHNGTVRLRMFIDTVNPRVSKKDLSLIRGFSTPDALTHSLSLRRLETYYTNLKMIFSVKHPIKWFMSWYNYVAYTNKWALYHGFKMKRPKEYIGNCGFDCETDCVAGVEAYYLVCTEFAKFHVHLSRLGWTPLDTEKELALLGNPKETIENYSVHNFVNQQLFIIEEGQMRDDDKERSHVLESAMETYIGVKDNTLSLKTNERSNTIKSNTGRMKNSIADPIDICDDEHREVREVLLEIGTNASQWISEYFIHSPKVFVANEDDFLHRIEQWKYDPCEETQDA